MILAAVVDRLQAKGAFLCSLGEEGLELVITSGRTRFNDLEVSEELSRIVSQNSELPNYLRWGDDLLIPLFDTDLQFQESKKILGLMGISGMGEVEIDELQKDFFIIVNPTCFDGITRQAVTNSNI